MKCPVCETEFKTKTVILEGAGVAEEYGKCPKCNYGYEFAYGATREHFRFAELQHVYTFTDLENKHYDALRELIITADKQLRAASE